MGDVCARTGEFQSADGQTKARYLNVGSWFQDDQGRISIKLLAMPLTPDPKTGVGCWLSLFHKQEDTNKPAPRQQPQAQARSAATQQNRQTRPQDTEEVPF
jgi:hypothetical protein